MLLSVFSVFSQETEHKIIWQNLEEERQVATIYVEIKAFPDKAEFLVNFRVQWLNSNASLITNSKDKPFLYLSEYHIEATGNSGVFCKTFTDPDTYDLWFSDNDSLRFGYNSKSIEKIELDFEFQYALSEEDVSLGKTYKLDFAPGSKLNVIIPANNLKREDKLLDQDTDTDPTPNPELIKLCSDLDSGIINLFTKTDILGNKIDSLNYQHQITQLDADLSSLSDLDSVRINQIKKDLKQKMLVSTGIINEIDDLLATEKALRKMLRGDLLPSDSIDQYQVRIGGLSRRIKVYLDDFSSHRNRIRGLQSNFGETTFPSDSELQMEILSGDYSQIFENQVDSLKQLKTDHESLLKILNPIIGELKSGMSDRTDLDSLMLIHNRIKEDNLEIRNSHRSSFGEYLDRTSETGSIRALEILHNNFERNDDLNTQQFTRLESDIDEMERIYAENQNKRDLTLIWVGGILLLVILVFVILRSLSNSKTKNKISLSTVGNTPNVLDFEAELTNSSIAYYPFKVSSKSESVVHEVNFSFRAIKAINQIVQGAISKKSPMEFGGYFFGHQYQTGDKGPGKYVVIVDQVVSSATIRPNFVPGVSESEDLVDEMGKLVSQNKKMSMLGWFSSSSDDDIEMNEDLIKLHRTFFRDKWQLAVLVNPTTDNLHSAIFLRRKSGFFETIPGEDYHLNIEDLYQYSLNPPIESQDVSVEKFPEDQYRTIILNQNWSDSIVQKISFHESVVESVMKELGNKRFTNQVASGFIYGKVELIDEKSGNVDILLFVNRFVIARNGEAPRQIPGMSLLGWINLGEKEIFESLKVSLPYHKIYFPKTHQISMIVNTLTKEFRIFSYKHNLELNNNIIETEEFNLDEIQS